MVKDKKWCVYAHTNIINGKQYIGITAQDNPEKRWRNGNGYKKGYFKNAIKKYGWDNFKHEILKDDIRMIGEKSEKESEFVYTSKKSNTDFVKEDKTAKKDSNYWESEF